MRKKLFNIRPAPMSNMIATASSAATSDPRRRSPAAPAEVRPPSFRASDKLVRHSASAGPVPNRIPVPIEAASVNASTEPSMLVS